MPSTPKTAGSRTRTYGLAAIAALLTILVTTLTHQVRNNTGLARLDPRIDDWIVAHRTEPLNALARAVTVLGDTLTLTVITVLTCAWLLRRGHRGDAVLVGVTGAGAALLTFVGKRLIGRARPPAVDRLAFEPSLSYPSGHSLGSMAVLGIVTVALLPRLHRTARRVTAVAAAICFVAAVGLSRVYLGVHWPTDVLAGWSIGALWVLMCVTAYGYARNRAEPNETDSPSGADQAP
ncbi:phosphatase PAP2 family protein [Nocardia takedensis]